MQLDVNTDDSFRGFLPGQQLEDDRMLIPRFFVAKKLMGAKSVAAGREIYEDREFVEIKIKGQDKQVVIEEVKERHKNQFPIAYQAFLLQKPAPVIGTPIEQLPGMGPSQAHSLKGLNLRTVEDLAAITDENTLSRIGMGARDLVRRAKAWLEQSTTKTVELEQQLAAAQELAAEKDKENAALRETLEEMGRRLKAVEEGQASKKASRKKAAEPDA